MVFAPVAVMVALWRGRLPLVPAAILTDGLLLSTVTLVLPVIDGVVPVASHISLIPAVLLMFLTCSALLPSRLVSDTVPVKYSTLVSAPPAYVKVPTFVEMVRLLFKVLFVLSTISSKTSATVIGSPGR